MSVIKIRGIIIKENKSGESDKFLTIFAKDIGKISVFAKGASNIKSKFLAGTSLFTYGDFLIRTATKTPTLNSVDIIENFYSITKDLDTYYCGIYLLEFVNKAVEDITDNNNYLYLLLKSLYALKSQKINSILTVKIFELKILKYLGYNPYNERCINCNSLNPMYFSVNGLVCKQCLGKSRIRELSEVTLYTLKYISESDIDNLFSFNVSDYVLNDLIYISEQFILYHLDCTFKSYEYIKNIY